MPENPKECRMHAARCAELATAARTPQLKTTFLALPKNSEKLAIQLEDAFAKLAEREDIWSNVQESTDEARRLRKKYSDTLFGRLHHFWQVWAPGAALVVQILGLLPWAVCRDLVGPVE
jgi:hypothetical protein